MVDVQRKRGIALPAPERGFRLQERDGLTLVSPRASKHTWAAEERWFRSLIVNRRGDVVSCGFPKFFNTDEPCGTEEKGRLVKDFAEGNPIWLESKIDGSLAIRSVIDDQVVFRTRNTFDGGPLREVIERVAREHYPALLDPSFKPDSSLLFEFVSTDPQYQVIIRPERDDLVFLDSVDHRQLRLASREEKEELARDAGLSLVETVPLPHSLNELAKQVAAWSGREGVVIRFDGGQGLLKLKSRSYLQLHRLKSQLTVSGIEELCQREKIETVEQFERLLRKRGADWETFEGAREIVESYCDALQAADKRFDELLDYIDDVCIRHPGDSGKVREAINSELTGAERESALLLFDGREAPASDRLRRERIEEALARFEAQEQEALLDDLLADG